MTPAEMARLQGFESGDIPWKEAGTPKTAKGHQIGNSMSVPVLQEAVRSVLTAAGLLSQILITSQSLTWDVAQSLTLGPAVLTADLQGAPDQNFCEQSEPLSQIQ